MDKDSDTDREMEAEADMHRDTDTDVDTGLEMDMVTGPWHICMYQNIAMHTTAAKYRTTTFP